MKLSRLFRNDSGAGAAEFALVLPAALLLLFGIIDVGRYSWQLNQYEKGTQMGARMAVVTDIVSVGLADPDLTYVGDTSCPGDPLVPGQRICADALGAVVCTSAGCACTGNCPSGAETLNDAAFNRIVARVRQFQPQVITSQISVEYRGSGIGFAGDPNKPEIAPIVTVRVNNAVYRSITLSPIGGGVSLPDFSYSLTLEDGEGSVSG